MNSYIIVSYFLILGAGGGQVPLSPLKTNLGAPQVCTSTSFGSKGDKLAGGDALYYKRPIDPKEDVGIAHRTLPIGSKAIVRNPDNNKIVVVKVVDRGPYGAGMPGKDWYIKRKRQESPPEELCEAIGDDTCAPRKWRGCVDLTPKAARLIEHKGLQRIQLWAIK